MSERGWIGVDLDGTLSHYDVWRSPVHVGAPVPKMIERVKGWLAEGKDVRVFTARVCGLLNWSRGASFREALEAEAAIKLWCLEHLGRELPVTCSKDYDMVELWDDRAVQVVPNTGLRADGRVS